MGLTQDELGAKTLLTGKMICALERGFSKGSCATWNRLEAILGVPKDHLQEIDSPSAEEAR
jgi:transcriptional regulator with XRE-family HTH domain